MNTPAPSAPPLAGSEFAPAANPVSALHAGTPAYPFQGVPPADDRGPEFEAAAQREAVYKAFPERSWRGVPMQPWSKERDTLFARLVEMDLPGESLDDLPRIITMYDEAKEKDPNLSSLEQILDVSLYFSSAAKLLWLALHGEEEILRLRTRPALFLSVIDKWSSENITDAEVFEACMLAAKVKNEWKQFRPMYRPSGRGGRDDSGNLPRLY